MVTLDDVRAARERIGEVLQATPCVRSDALSSRCDAAVHLKLESLQRTGSFKARGALNKLLQMSRAERDAGVIAASAGNHAQGVAFAAAEVGARARIVMPATTPLVKVARTREFGAEVDLFGDNFDEAYERARELEREHGYSFVHPFDDPLIVAGQGTVGLELLEQVPELGAVVVPIGGGGLIAGIAVAVKEQRPEVAVYGVQSEAAPSMQVSLDAGHREERKSAPSIAEGISTKRPGELTFELTRKYADGVVVVSEAAIEGALFELLDVGKTLAEGAGAAAAAALLEGLLPELAGRRVAVLVSGANIDLGVLNRVIERSLARHHRLVRLHIRVKDRPGGLAALLQVIARGEANILRIEHHRVFTDTSFWETEVELTLETRDRGHIETLIASLHEAGYQRVQEVRVPGQ
ncbi:MAG: threonine ammonia-lyase [Thermoanaerobaculia bacterium]